MPVQFVWPHAWPHTDGPMHVYTQSLFESATESGVGRVCTHIYATCFSAFYTHVYAHVYTRAHHPPDTELGRPCVYTCLRLRLRTRLRTCLYTCLHTCPICQAPNWPRLWPSSMRCERRCIPAHDAARARLGTHHSEYVCYGVGLHARWLTSREDMCI